MQTSPGRTVLRRLFVSLPLLALGAMLLAPFGPIVAQTTFQTPDTAARQITHPTTADQAPVAKQTTDSAIEDQPPVDDRVSLDEQRPVAVPGLDASMKASGSPTYLAAGTLPSTVAQALEARGVAANSFSVFVQDARNRKVLANFNADLSRSPASTMKVVTTFAALDILGPAFTWKTQAYALGTVRGDRLQGDLVLVGGGDPYMTIERWWAFVDGLRQTGLKHIDGDVIIDATYFAPAEQDRAEFDGQPFRSYNVLPDALMINFQTSQFNIRPDTGGRVNISVDPLPAGLVVKNEVRVGKGRCGANRGIDFSAPVDDPRRGDPARGDWDDIVTVQGVLPESCGRFNIPRVLLTAPRFAYGTFRTLWEQQGGSISGKLKPAKLSADAKLVYSFDSLSLAEIIRLVNKHSNNVMARHLLLTLAAERFGAPATTDNGRRAVEEWLAQHDIRNSGLVLENGSGLSRAERISAHGMAQVLQTAWDSEFMPEFASSLPLAATDGTLRNRFRASGMQGRIRMKTGRIDDVSALAGFINAESGRTYIAVMILNSPGAQSGPGEEAQAAMVRWVFGQ